MWHSRPRLWIGPPSGRFGPPLAGCHACDSLIVDLKAPSHTISMSAQTSGIGIGTIMRSTVHS